MGFKGKGEKLELIALRSSLHCISFPISNMYRLERRIFVRISSSELRTKVTPVGLRAACKTAIREISELAELHSMGKAAQGLQSVCSK